MRGYMAQPCSAEFPLEKKLRCFLTAGLRIYRVPEGEVQQALDFIAAQDVRSTAQQVMGQLFRKLAMHYDFSLTGLLPDA